MSNMKQIIDTLVAVDPIPSNKTALVLMSGGQDSTTCLNHALRQYKHVHAIAFDYGQKHAVELECAATICIGLGVRLHCAKVPALQLMQSSSLITGDATGEKHAYLTGRPSTFVPVRNATFLSIAFGVAMEIKASTIITGVCETDYSGYPDCRDIFIREFEQAMNTGYEQSIAIDTPLMWLDKAHTFLLADKLSCLDMIINYTHTCYNGDHVTLYDWGYGCGACPACDVRANGYDGYLELIK